MPTDTAAFRRFAHRRLAVGAPPTNVDRLLALLDRWRSEPTNGDDGATVAELDRTFLEEPIQFRELDLFDWEEEDE